MNWNRLFSALILSGAMVAAAQGGVLFGKHAKPKPSERVPQLIALVKTDAKEGKRVEAARELREYDPKAFPEIMPTLIDVAQHDASSGVRAEAVQALGKLRPVSQEAGWVIQQATHDGSILVRWQARSALVGYRLAGYRSTPNMETVSAPKQPAQAPPKSVLQKVFGSSRPAASPIIGSGETSAPPLADPEPATAGTTAPKTLIVPTKTPALPAPEKKNSDQGPDLIPPQ
jgi:hypothetical protein